MLPVRATAVSCPGPACSAGPLISWLPGEPLRGDYMLAGCYNPALRHRPLLKHWYSISELLQLRSSPCTPPGHIISSTIKELGTPSSATICPQRQPEDVCLLRLRKFHFLTVGQSAPAKDATSSTLQPHRAHCLSHSATQSSSTRHQQKLISSEMCTSQHPFT